MKGINVLNTPMNSEEYDVIRHKAQVVENLADRCVKMAEQYETLAAQNTVSTCYMNYARFMGKLGAVMKETFRGLQDDVIALNHADTLLRHGLDSMVEQYETMSQEAARRQVIASGIAIPEELVTNVRRTRPIHYVATEPVDEALVTNVRRSRPL